MNGRVYDPAIGRFLSVDPVFQFPTNTQSLNPYSYVLNSPLSLTDPTGYEATGEEMQEGDSVAERDSENGGNTVSYTKCQTNCTNTMTVTVDKSGASGGMGQAGGQSVGSVSIEGAGSVGVSSSVKTKPDTTSAPDEVVQ